MLRKFFRRLRKAKRRRKHKTDLSAKRLKPNSADPAAVATAKTNSLKEVIGYAEAALTSRDWPEAIRRWQTVLDEHGSNATPRLADAASALNARSRWPEERSCNICGCPLFGGMKSRENVKCMGCGSLERTRMLYLRLQALGLPKPNSRVFHLAPEKGIYEAIAKTVGPEDYVVADIEPTRYRFAKNAIAFDLCQDVENLPGDHFDLIIHSHVFEHIKCNYSYVLKHLHRSLKDDGWHVCVIPFMSGHYDECFGKLSREEATRRFGQFDHVRRFGTEDIHHTLGRAIRINVDYDATKEFSTALLQKHNIPEKSWKGLTPDTVLALGKNDYIL